MDIVIGNVLFDKDYKLVGVLDWEWSRVVPAQLMMPPIWLTAGNLESVLLIQQSYNKQVAYLRTAIQEREHELGLPPLLSAEWAALETWYVINSIPQDAVLPFQIHGSHKATNYGYG